MKHRHRAIAAIVALVAMSPCAHAQQQQEWAAAYIDWTIPDGVTGVDRMAQDIAVIEPAHASFFTLNWDFTTGEGGYIGLQSDVDGAGNVRFSLWNAAAARGESCRRFDGEGVGMTCVLPMELQTDRFYRVRVARSDADAHGQWWTGWVDTVDASGQTRSFRIGDLQVASRLNEIAPLSIYNFNEYWGDAVRTCSEVPMSAAIFGAPSLQHGRDRIVARSPVGRRPDGHACATGRERTGASASHVNVVRGSEPAMIMVLGGDTAANRAFGVQAGRSVPTSAPSN